MERSCARAPRDPPAHAHSAPVANSLRWSATCVTIDKPMLIHYYQLKPTIDITGRSVLRAPTGLFTSSVTRTTSTVLKTPAARPLAPHRSAPAPKAWQPLTS